MKKRAIFYHAGCPVCASAERAFVGAARASRVAGSGVPRSPGAGARYS